MPANTSQLSRETGHKASVVGFIITCVTDLGI